MTLPHIAYAAVLTIVMTAAAVAAHAQPLPPLPDRPTTSGERVYTVRLFCGGRGVGQLGFSRLVQVTPARAAPTWRLLPLGSGYYRFLQLRPTEGSLEAFAVDGPGKPRVAQLNSSVYDKFKAAWYVGAITNGSHRVRQAPDGFYLTCPPPAFGGELWVRPSNSNGAVITFEVLAERAPEEPTHDTGASDAWQACKSACIEKLHACRRGNGFGCRTIYNACLRRCG
jgi:hypothetical protein